MHPLSFRIRSLFAALALTLLMGVGFQTASPSADDATVARRPRLAVLVIFDQLRGDYLQRWQAQFGDDGFRRLLKDGAWFQNCHYPYAHTVTAAGHASVATGCAPAVHGIVGNEWLDRVTGESVGCVETNRWQRVPPPAPGIKLSKKPTGVSPERMLAPALGDALKEGTGGRGRVVSLSFKDRSAALPAGKRPDACYWLDATSGLMVTSTYYRDTLHPWVAAFNRARPADRWFGKSWDRLRPDLDYDALSGPDDVKGEGIGAAQGRTFPHPMASLGSSKAPLAPYYLSLYNSPFGNELLLEMVKRAIDAEHLGGNDTPDLLCVSFSSNDPIGHIWGPDSQEVFDATLRSDLIMRDLLTCLDAKVGKGRYVLALTADHGMCPLPEVSQAQGKEAVRLSPSLLRSQAEEYLATRFHKQDAKAVFIAGAADEDIYLKQSTIQSLGLVPAEVERALADWLKQQPGVLTAYTRTQLLAGLPADDALGQTLRRSYYAERSGDVLFVLKPYHLCVPLLTGSAHGSPHAYDTHVPLLVYGAGVQPGVRQERVTPLAVPVILSRALGIRPPARAQADVPDKLLLPLEKRAGAPRPR